MKQRAFPGAPTSSHRRFGRLPPQRKSQPQTSVAMVDATVPLAHDCMARAESQPANGEPSLGGKALGHERNSPLIVSSCPPPPLLPGGPEPLYKVGNDLSRSMIWQSTNLDTDTNPIPPRRTSRRHAAIPNPNLHALTGSNGPPAPSD
jgi:hypothetical protein